MVGCVVGCIGGVLFEFNNEIYCLEKNEGNNYLYGGKEGFSYKIWNVKIIEIIDYVGVEFIYVSKDGEEGYFGNFEVKVMYILMNKNEFYIFYEGIID